MPDAWALLYSFNLNNGGDAAVDSDGDGFSNYSEYLAGTHPRDDRSYPAINSVFAWNQTMHILSRVAPNRSYSVMYCDELSEGPWLKLKDIEAQPDARLMSVTDNIPLAAPLRFYRLVTPALP